MRYDAQHKQRTREKVVAATAKAIRRHGPESIGIASLMGQVGLTHGGFYAHFSSKDDLLREAILWMFDESYALLLEALKDLTPTQRLVALVERYLSPEHCEQRDMGCPMAALSGDLPRMTQTVRAAFLEGAKRSLNRLASLLEEAGYADTQALALSIQSEMLGAVALARAMPDTAFAQTVLTSCRDQIVHRLQLREVPGL